MKADCLVYFKDQNVRKLLHVLIKKDTDPKGVITLDNNCVVLDAVADTKKPFSFGIYSQDGKRTFFLCAESEENKTEWMMAIQWQINEMRLVNGEGIQKLK